MYCVLSKNKRMIPFETVIHHITTSYKVMMKKAMQESKHERTLALMQALNEEKSMPKIVRFIDLEANWEVVSTLCQVVPPSLQYCQ